MATIIGDINTLVGKPRLAAEPDAQGAKS